MKARNDARRAESYARNFGAEADIVRTQPCCVRGCLRFAQAAHVVPRGMGGRNGGRFDLVPLCDEHHREAGEERTTARVEFERRYRLDLREIADRIAVEHQGPLGLRSVAVRWLFPLPGNPEPYEEQALFAWARRWADRTAARMPGENVGGFAVSSVARALRIEMLAAAQLLEAAGWNARASAVLSEHGKENGAPRSPGDSTGPL